MPKYLIGIDGGGSKTEFLLTDTLLNVIGRRIDKRSNPNDIGIENTESIMTENVSALINDNNIEKCDISAVFAGIAGLAASGYAERLKDTLRGLLPQTRIEADHDGINVICGNLRDNDGVCVICGTGSVCFVKKGGTIKKIGGYGIFDLAGNGYEIGKAAVAHALKTTDGREKRGKLESLLESKLGTDIQGAIGKLSSMSKTDIAALAPIVFESAKQGDKTAMMIIFENMSYIADLINLVGENFDNEFTVALSGGIFENSSAIDIIESLANPRAKLVKSNIPPVYGAVIKAKTLL